MLIDGSVQIAPFAAELDIGLINPDRAAMGSTKLPQPFLDDRCISQYPAVDRAMIDLEAPLAKHLFQVTIAERVAQAPGNRLYNQPGHEMPALDIILRLALQLFRNRIQSHRLAPQYQERQLLSPWSTSSYPEEFATRPCVPLRRCLAY